MPIRIAFKSFLLFLCLAFCAACVKKQEQLYFFEVKTLKPESGDQLGIVKLKGSLLNAGPEGVEEHGFFWSDDKTIVDSPDTLLTPRISLGQKSTSDIFITEFNLPDPSKIYYFRAFSKREARLAIAPQVEVFTLNLLLTLEPSLTQIDNDQALVTAQVRGLDVLRASVSGRGFVWSSKNEVPLVGVDETLEINGRTFDGYFADTLKDLNPATAYYVRSFLRTDADIFYSAVDTVIIKDVWRSTTQPFDGRKVWGAFSAVAGDKAYVGCGCDGDSPDGKICLGGNLINEIWEFNSLDQSWKKLNVRFPDDYKRANAVAFAINQKLYIGLGGAQQIGYQDIYRDFWELDLNTYKFIQVTTNFPGRGRTEATAFKIGNRAYVGAGRSIVSQPQPEEVSFNDFYVYEPSVGWDTIPPLPLTNNFITVYDQGRWGATAFSDGISGYVLGGLSGIAQLSDCWIYNPGKDNWEAGPFLPVPQQNALAFVIDQRAYLGLGWNKYTGFLDDWHFLDLKNQKKWQIANRFRGKNRANAYGFALQNKGYVGGGRGLNVTNTSLELRVFDDTWMYFPYPY